MKEYALVIEGLTVSYAARVALWDINVRIRAGQLVGVVGPNGAGKSTLLKAVMGLVRPRTGRVQVFGNQVNNQRQRISYVPQRESVDWNFPISVKEVVLMGAYGKQGLWRRLSKTDKMRANDCLARVNMLGYAKQQIGALSGGQQQRIFLARALMQTADLYLMDEPFAGIDVTTEELILNVLKTLAKQGKTLLIVFHGLQSLIKYFDHFLLLNRRLVAQGRQEEVFTPENIEDSYGSTLNILTEVHEQIKHKGYPKD